MSTNFLPFDVNLINAEVDSTYLTDTARINGAAASSILPSALFNKVIGQQSIFISALCQALLNKGYSTSDSNWATLVAVLSNIKTSADFGATIVTVSYASSITFNAATAPSFDLTLTGNVTSSTLINTSAGQLLLFIVSQDATGARTFSWPPSMSAPGSICPLALSSSLQLFIVRPAGAIDPITPMLWLTSGGIIFPPPRNPVVFVSTSGNCQAIATEVTEEVSATSGAITRNLYTAVGFAGFKVNVKNLNPSVSITVQPIVGGQTIDGIFTSFSIGPYNAISFLSDGANWILV